MSNNVSGHILLLANPITYSPAHVDLIKKFMAFDQYIQLDALYSDVIGSIFTLHITKTPINVENFKWIMDAGADHYLDMFDDLRMELDIQDGRDSSELMEAYYLAAMMLYNLWVKIVTDTLNTISLYSDIEEMQSIVCEDIKSFYIKIRIELEVK